MKRRYFALSSFAVVATIGGWCIHHFVGGAHEYPPLDPGNTQVPVERTMEWNKQSALTERILTHWSNKPLGDWKTGGKINVPRALMGRLLSERDLEAANAYLQALTPWGQPGSTWALHKEGDYDFTMTGLVPILFLFGDKPDVLYPASRDHLLNVLLTLEGGDPQQKVPRTFGLVQETENHLLMTEGSRYLKNRWLALHGSDHQKHDNLANGLEPWLLQLIEKLRKAGLYEFNSIPYEGYTLTALLNLEAFGSESIREAARGLLDQINWRYAVGSLNYRRFPPFRRQYVHADDTALNGDRHVALIKTWMSLSPKLPEVPSLSGSEHIALWGCWSPYRLPDETARWILRKPTDYFVRMGHGPEASPEIYSGGTGWLLTAGGVNRGSKSMIVARPITLLLDDEAVELSQTLHLAGPSEDFRKWNNTGVWKKFAVAAGPVHTPADWTADREGKLWKVYRRGPFCIAVYSQADVGIVYLLRTDDAQSMLKTMENDNSDAGKLLSVFQEPGGSRIEYDLAAPKNRWVIKQVDHRQLDREFDHWPLIESE